LIDKLKSRKRVTRKISKTSRRYLDISITKDGMKIYEELTPLLTDHQNYMDKRFTTADAKSLNELLDKLRGVID
jgi:DNA-binding MarR family transcriptional regulator